mgnify:CR=1 FL=1
MLGSVDFYFFLLNQLDIPYFCGIVNKDIKRIFYIQSDHGGRIGSK